MPAIEIRGLSKSFGGAPVLSGFDLTVEAREFVAVLADEPVSALDPSAAEQIVALLAELAGEGLAVIAVLHQPALARRHADRIAGLLRGRLVFDAPPTALGQAEVDALYEPAAVGVPQ